MPREGGARGPQRSCSKDRTPGLRLSSQGLSVQAQNSTLRVFFTCQQSPACFPSHEPPLHLPGQRPCPSRANHGQLPRRREVGGDPAHSLSGATAPARPHGDQGAAHFCPCGDRTRNSGCYRERGARRAGDTGLTPGLGPAGSARVCRAPSPSDPTGQARQGSWRPGGSLPETQTGEPAGRAVKTPEPGVGTAQPHGARGTASRVAASPSPTQGPWRLRPEPRCCPCRLPVVARESGLSSTALWFLVPINSPSRNQT